MITYFKFLLLSLQAKKQYLSEHGTLLLTYPQGTGEINLYAVSDFFVELEKDEHEQVVQLLTYKNTKGLDHHIGRITLNQLQK